MQEAITDTDTLSFYLRGYPAVVEKMENYREEFGYLNIPIVTHFEILNGLFRKDARKQLEKYQAFVRESIIVNLDEYSVEISAKIVAKLHHSGQSIGYLDTLIAGIALRDDFILITNNVNHFSRIEDLEIDNWT